MADKEEDHYCLTDDEFTRRFSDLTLDPAWFTHEAHLRLGWILIGQLGLEKASTLVCQQIRRFDQTFGDGTKYHETITLAFMQLIYLRQRMNETKDFSTFIRLNQDLISQYRGIFSKHYSMDVFSSKLAADKYIAPDLMPFK